MVTLGKLLLASMRRGTYNAKYIIFLPRTAYGMDK